ncbi:hypothetical protein ZWY2020_055013 [Hordeum vulgare]|nr:hypothetical protein ZWY2020_055013 [Hordeum vulgare]
MSRREAALILGVRYAEKFATVIVSENVLRWKIKEAHKRVMVANHPDGGGSHYIASKINEANDMLMGKGKSGSIF